MGRSTSASKTPVAWLCVTVFILMFQAALVLMHEPWLDEWQSLQLAVQSPSLGQLLSNLRYEGHPPFYYLLLRGTAEIVPFPWVLIAVQLPVALAIQAMILFQSFPERRYRLLFALSPFVLIDYGIIARSLSVGVLIFLTAWAFRKRRWAWAAIVLLPAVDFLFGVLSLICLMVFWRNRNWSWIGAALWLVSSLLAAWAVIPAPDVVPALPPSNNPVVTAFAFLANLAQLLLPLPLSEKGLVWNASFPVVIGCVVGFFALVSGWWMRPRRPYHQIALASFVGICLLFSLSVYMLPIRHLSLLALLLIVLLWREQDMGIEPSRLFSAWLFIAAACGVFLGAVNLIYPFDTGAQAALWLRRSHLTDKHWVSIPDNRAQGVALLNGMRFTRLGKICQQDFIRWDNKLFPKSDSMTIRQLRKLSKDYGKYYILSDIRIIMPPKEIKQIFRAPKGFNGQEYYFYEFGGRLPTSKLRPPECQAGRIPVPPASIQQQAVRQRIRQRLQASLGISPTTGEVPLR